MICTDQNCYMPGVERLGMGSRISPYIPIGMKTPPDYWEFRCLRCGQAINPTEEQFAIHTERRIAAERGSFPSTAGEKP